MSVYITSDPHLGHKNIHTFRPWVTDSDHNTQLFIDDWKKTIRKNDIVYILGDVAFTDEALELLRPLLGRKILIKGNHDDMVSTKLQAEIFEEIYGMLKYKKMWFSHAPVHPQELRGKPSVHGHVHYKSVKKVDANGEETEIDDPRYINVCVDQIWPKFGTMFLKLEDLKVMAGV